MSKLDNGKSITGKRACTIARWLSTPYLCPRRGVHPLTDVKQAASNATRGATPKMGVQDCV